MQGILTFLIKTKLRTLKASVINRAIKNSRVIHGVLQRDSNFMTTATAEMKKGVGEMYLDCDHLLSWNTECRSSKRPFQDHPRSKASFRMTMTVIRGHYAVLKMPVISDSGVPCNDT